MLSSKVQRNIPVLTLWTQLSPHDRRLYRSGYTVQFFLPVVPPSTSLIFATFLLWFLDKARVDVIISDVDFNPRGFATLRNLTLGVGNAREPSVPLTKRTATVFL